MRQAPSCQHGWNEKTERGTRNVTAKSEVQKTLGRLQQLIRRPPSDNDERAAMTRLLPLELTGGKTEYIRLLSDEVEASEMVKAALLADLRFEHMSKPDDDVWRFVGECWTDGKTDHVPGFIKEHSQEPMDRVCFVPVENLSVTSATDVLGIRLLPIDDPGVPTGGLGFSLEKPVGCVAAIAVRGTNHGLMVERARLVAAHALRVMRIALREHHSIHDRQLRFRLGIVYAFDDHVSGWQTRADVAYDLGLPGDLIEMAENQPIWRLPVEPTTDVDKKADLALQWMERAWFTGEPLVALLYLFFALEALLGDKSEKLKAHGLAFRQTMLSHIIEGNFTHPNRTWFLYDAVRSAAVHGEGAPDVDKDVVQNFAWGVRKALSQYLTLASNENFVRRGRLLTFLDEHPERPQLVAWLREAGGDTWTKYLDNMEGTSAGNDHEGS
jgi:hypothetical protein